jgi:PH (Pleckstrin Homology) domain-containing protein
MARPLGLGPIPTAEPLGDTEPLIVRQAAPMAVGVFVMLIMSAMGAAVLADPGPTVGSGNAFVDRWFFGILIVPLFWGADRFLLRPRVRVDGHGVAFHNPIQTVDMPWPAVLGAGFEGKLQLVLADGDQVRSILFGPALSSPLTKRDRVDQLIEVVNAESSRRSGRTRDPGASYEAEDLIGSLGSERAPQPPKPGATRRPSYGLMHLAIYAGLWTIACAAAAVLR